MKILVFDNYDSFTYNLVHLVEKIIGEKVEVHRNDQIKLEDVARFDKIILSPGPGIPEEAGLLLPLIKTYAPTKPILGVCLGHQAIGQALSLEICPALLFSYRVMIGINGHYRWVLFSAEAAAVFMINNGTA